ncbi:MAG TPA: hypothetical protein VM755_16625 [Stellaceae bacterium]|nr:hypothetical protein [Stellaceae bacterium]
MSLYGDAIWALRQVILLNERVRNTALDVERLSAEISNLRDRVSRLEGMLSGAIIGAGPTTLSRRRRLPGSPGRGSPS